MHSEPGLNLAHSSQVRDDCLVSGPDNSDQQTHQNVVSMMTPECMSLMVACYVTAGCCSCMFYTWFYSSAIGVLPAGAEQ